MGLQGASVSFKGEAPEFFRVLAEVQRRSEPDITSINHADGHVIVCFAARPNETVTVTKSTSETVFVQSLNAPALFALIMTVLNEFGSSATLPAKQEPTGPPLKLAAIRRASVLATTNAALFLGAVLSLVVCLVLVAKAFSVF